MLSATLALAILAMPSASTIPSSRSARIEVLGHELGRLATDPLTYVKVAFPWGVKGSVLERETLEDWQAAKLDRIGREIRARKFDGQTPAKPILEATSSGHGIGKSGLCGMVVDWLRNTWPHSIGTVTANTGRQLKDKTFAQLCKWANLSRFRAWWTISPGGLFIRHKNPAFQSTWFVQGVTWREHDAEAFAGQHAPNSVSYYIFDEASRIPVPIWDTAFGGMTDGQPLFLAFGNPTRNSGKFREIFTKERGAWNREQIDARDVKRTNKALFDQWAQDYGEDSDFFRVRVRGLFPRKGAAQFISREIIDQALRAPAQAHIDDPLVFALDVARFGDCETVLAKRRGLDARTLPWCSWRDLDTMETVGRVSEEVEATRKMGLEVEILFVDEVGVGAGVVDRLRQLGYPVVGINAGRTAHNPRRFSNLGTESWQRMAEWMGAGGAIPNDDDLARQLEEREYDYDAQNRPRLTSKDVMREDGLESPDRADALALSFAVPVAPRMDRRLRARASHVAIADDVTFRS